MRMCNHIRPLSLAVIFVLLAGLTMHTGCLTPVISANALNRYCRMPPMTRTELRAAITEQLRQGGFNGQVRIECVGKE